MTLEPWQQRLVVEVDGWIDLDCCDKAIERLQPLLDDPATHSVAIGLRARALVALGRHTEALADIGILRALDADPEWLDLTEAWCRKRTGNLDGAIRCMKDLLARDPRSAIGHFNLGCYLALAGRLEDALDEVSIACGMDETFRSHATDETDLDGLRGDPRFAALLRAGTERHD